MLKNILKSIAWLSLYFLTTIIGSILAMLFCLFSGNVEIPENLDNTSVFTSFTTELIAKSVVPGIIIASLICIIVYIIYKFAKKSNFKSNSFDLKKVLFCIGIGLFLNFILSVLLTLLSPVIPQQLNDTLNDALNLALTGHPVIILLGAGILGPIAEEIIFRHGVHRTLSRSNIVVGYIVSSLLFGIAHGNVLQGIYATIFGLIFAFMLTNTNNLFYPVIIHTTINTSSIITTFLPQNTPQLSILGIMFILSLTLTLPFIKTDSIKEMFIKNRKKAGTI